MMTSKFLQTNRHTFSREEVRLKKYEMSTSRFFLRKAVV